MTTHYAWTHIEALKNVNKYVSSCKEIIKPVVNYRGKIKLHGTNAGVQVSSEGVFAQSRNHVLTVEKDNAGFGFWLRGQEECFQTVFDNLVQVDAASTTMVVYGEWAGLGIMKGTSVSKIGKRIFAIFAVRLIGKDTDRIIFDPAYLAEQFVHAPDDVHVLPWSTDVIECDFNDTVAMKGAAQKFNEYVEKVEVVDPWVKEVFDVEGNGEGYVFYPLMKENYEEFQDFVFKAKGDKHRVEGSAGKVFVKITPEDLANIAAFVEMFVTEDRLEQAVREACDGEIHIEKTGSFMQWIGRDIAREGALELKANNLEWKKVVKHVSTTARKWWLLRIREVWIDDVNKD